jgi:DUF4097 and DUF4098 domain-containing protein YvlB
MLTTLTIGALALVTSIQATDTTFAAQGAHTLELENAGGSVVVRTWDQDQVRVVADHSRRTEIDIGIDDGVVEIEPEGSMGPATVVDFQITIPRGMHLVIEGMYTDVDAEGLGGDVEVETLQGNVHIRGGDGDIMVESVNGEVRIEGARGRIEATSVSQPVWLTDVSGEVMVETVSGSIRMSGISSDRVDAGTVTGRIIYEGTITNNGRYFFGAHSGQIVLALEEGVNARVTATTLSGSLSGTYPGLPQNIDTRSRDGFTLGNGSAEVEIETFSGSIVIRRKGDMETREELAWREGRHNVHGQAGEWAAFGAEMGAMGAEMGAMGSEIAAELTGEMSWLAPVITSSLEVGLGAAEWGMRVPGAYWNSDEFEDLEIELQDMEIQLKGLDDLGERINRAMERSRHKRRN